MTIVPRRRMLKGAGLAGLAVLLPPEVLAACSATSAPATRKHPSGTQSWLVFDAHEAGVVEEATARLIPGPQDDPAEAGHPGAREANVTRYIDTMLGALRLAPSRIFAGGPFSNRAGAKVDDMATFLGLTPAQTRGWTARLATFRSQYREGVQTLDKMARRRLHEPQPREDGRRPRPGPRRIHDLAVRARDRGMYSVPEYGGNAALVGWQEIDWPGDRQPLGFTDTQVSLSDGPDPYVPAGIGEQLVKLLGISP